MAGDFNKPVTTDLYTAVLQWIRDMFADIAKMFDGTGTANAPDGAIRWNSTTKRWEKKSGASWPELIPKATDKYDINVDRVDGFDAGNASGNIPVSNGTLCTNLNADKVDGYNADAGTTATTIPVRNASGVIPGSADKVDGFDASTSATANTIPVRDSNAKVPGSITGDAATVGGFTPNQAAVASGVAVRDSNGKLAGDILGNAATATSATSATSASNATEWGGAVYFVSTAAPSAGTGADGDFYFEREA